MKIANIVTTNKIEVDDNIHIIDHYNKRIIGLPTLVTSYDWVTENFEEYDYYDKQLGVDLFWTFSKTERRDIFYNDVEDFIILVNQRMVDKIKYIFVDPISLSINQIKKIIKKINLIKKIITYKYMDMLYVYGDNIIFGLDLNLLNYLHINIERLETKIKNISQEFLVGNEILIEYKDSMERLNDSVKYIPYLYSIKHE